MDDDEIGIGLTPGIALVAAGFVATEEPEPLRDIIKYVRVTETLGSTIQTALALIDWYAVNKVGDQIAVAYENDDHDELERLRQAGFAYYPREDGTLDLLVGADTASETPFPDDLWAAMNERVLALLPLVSEKFDVPERSITSIIYAIAEEGVMSLREHISQINISYPEERKGISAREVAYSVAVACGLFTHALIMTAAEMRTEQLAAIGLEPVTYEEVVDTIREAMTAMLLEEEAS